MKKSLSILIAVIIMLSSVTIMPSAVSAAATKTKKNNETFYPVSYSLCGNSYGYVTLDNENLILVKKPNGYISKTINYIKIKDLEIAPPYEVGFFMRGKTVIFTDGENTYSVGLDGKNRKILTKKKKNSSIDILGGYGTDVIVVEYIYKEIDRIHCKKINVYKVNATGKMTKLITLSNKYNQISLFGNKVYCSPYKKGNTKVCNIKTKKNTTVSRRIISYGKKNMYYINKDNLIRVDLKGKKKTVAKNVYKILDVNDGSTVLYSKLDKSKNEVYYRQTGDKKGKKIGTFDEIAKRAVSIFNKYEKNCEAKAKESYIENNKVKAKIVGKRIAFSINACYLHTPIILSTNLNGKDFTTEKLPECYESIEEVLYFTYTCLENVGNTLAFRSCETVEGAFYGVEFEEIND